MEQFARKGDTDKQTEIPTYRLSLPSKKPYVTITLKLTKQLGCWELLGMIKRLLLAFAI